MTMARKRRAIFIFVATLAVLGAIFAWMALQPVPLVPTPFAHPDVGAGVAHAAGGIQTDCASCHTQPVSGGCADCHTAPPTIILGDIDFSKHHDETAVCSSCHGAGDARYAQVPTASHVYCVTCHEPQHS